MQPTIFQVCRKMEDETHRNCAMTWGFPEVWFPTGWHGQPAKFDLSYGGVPEIGVPFKSSILVGDSLMNPPLWGTAIYGNPHNFYHGMR